MRSLAIICFILSSISALGQSSKIDSLETVMESLKERDTVFVKVQNELAYLYMNVTPNTTLQLAQAAQELSQSLNYLSGLGRSYSLQGGYYWTIGDYAQSLKFYLLSLDVYKKVGDKVGIAKTYNNIAEAFVRQNELNKALEYHLLALEYKRKELPNVTPLVSYHNIGDLYYKLKQYDKAIDYQILALRAAIEKKNETVIAYSYLGLGNIYSDLEEYEKALSNFYMAIKESRKLSDQRILGVVYGQLGKLYLTKNRYDSAIISLLESNKYADNMNALDIKLENYRTLSHLYQSQDDYEAAFESINTYSQLKDSLYNQEKLAELARLETLHDIKARQTENELLKKDNELKNVRLKEQTTTILLGIISTLFLFVVVFVLYQQRNSKTKDNQLLQAQNEEINKHKEEIAQQSENLAKLNQKLTDLNSTLEKKVEKRTLQLKKHNEALSEYAFLNAHKLRSPLANILGLVELFDKVNNENDRSEIIDRLKNAANELNIVVTDIRKTLEKAED